MLCEPPTMGNSTSSDEAPPAEDKSYYGQAKTGYSALVNAIIRPPRTNRRTRKISRHEVKTPPRCLSFRSHTAHLWLKKKKGTRIRNRRRNVRRD